MVTWDECEELAAYIVGINYDECEDNQKIWEAIEEKYEIDDNAFQTIVSDLMPLIQVGKSELTNTLYKGFGKSDSKGNAEMIVKMKVRY